MAFELPPGLSPDETLLVDVLDGLAARRLGAAAAVIDETGEMKAEIPDLLAQHGFLEPLDDLRCTLLLVERLARTSAAVATLPAGPADACAAAPHVAAARSAFVDGGAAVTATIDGFGWRLDGSAARVEWAAESDRFVVVAETPDGPALFEVDPFSAGVDLGPRHATTGMLGVPVRPVAFEAVRPINGQPAGSESAVRRGRRHRALTGAAMAVGVSAAAVEAAIAYAGQRHQFGRRLSEFGAVRAMIAAMEARTVAAATLLWDAVPPGTAQAGPAAARAAAVAVEAALSVTCDAVQIHGGYGYMREPPVERCMRDAASIAARTGGSYGLIEESAAWLRA